MADNTILNTGTGGDTIATDDIGGVKYQRVKIGIGVDGAFADVATSAPLPVNDAGGSLTVDGSVSLAAAVPAGTNNIGDVDVLTAPATAADGAAGLPAVQTVIAGYDGTNVQAIVTDSTGRVAVNVNGTVPVSGTVTANAGTGPFPVSDNAGSLTVDAPVGTPAFVRLSDGAAAITTLPVSIATAPVLVTGSATIGKVGLDPQTSGGLTPSMTISAASTNATSVKGSAGQLYGLYVSNINAAVRYLKLYNKASAPTVGTDTPVLVFAIPGNTAGAGFTIEFTNGVAFGTGIAFALTTGVATADTGAVAANEIVVNLGYK